VRTGVAESRTVERALSVTGSLLPDETVVVTAEVPGRLSKLYVDFGQPVRKGQVIAELDKEELSLQLERARGALAQALARLGLDAKQEDVVPETTPMMRQAWNQMEDARSKYENAAKLVKTGDISQERFTEMEKMYRAREAAFEATRDEMRTLLAQTRSLRADVKLAEKRLRDATVYAPFDGSIAEKPVTPGQYLKENVPIVTLVKTDPMRLRVEIPESMVASVKVGGRLNFTTDAAPNAVFQAVIRELNPGLDARSRTLTAEARLTSADARLRPGAFVQVKLITEQAVAVVSVPRAAVYTVAGLNKVFTIDKGRAIEHRLEEILGSNGWVEIPEGRIKPGDTVAISNVAQLTNGAVVEVQGAPAGKS
jgi:RND family efflux transporter MFP subunit